MKNENELSKNIINSIQVLRDRFNNSESIKSKNSIQKIDNKFESDFNILVVEDDKGLNKLIQKALKKEEFKTDGAFCGKDAIDKIVYDQNIILLLDYFLPDMTGKQLIETLIKKKCEIPFIIMTGNGDEKLAVEMMKMGARDYLIKDVNLMNYLLQVTKRVGKEINREKKLKDAEKALKESEEKYSTLVEQAMDGVVIVQDERFKFANSTMTDLTGYKTEEIVGLHFLDLIFPRDDRVSIERKRLLMAGIDGPSFYQAKLLCKDKVLKDVEISIDKMKYNGNSVIMGIIRDITERKKAEDALYESKEMYKTLVNTSPDAVTMTDLDGNITYLSPRTLELHGFDCAEELLGKNAFELIAPGDRKKAEKKMANILKDGIVRNQTYTLLKKDKRQFKGGLNAALIKDQSGTPKGLIVTTRDITKQKKMEEDLKKYAEHLEDEVRQRTTELIQSEKMAALGELVAGVAHEINNPLGYIKSNTELIKMKLEKLKKSCIPKDLDVNVLNEFEHQINVNLNGINKIATIIKTFKRFSKAETEGWIYSDINQGLKDTLVMVYNQLKHRVEVIEDYGELPEILCNIGQLNQVFMNLIINSSQAMDKGMIWIKTWQKNNHVYIEIKDNGCGIPRDILTRVFDPFFTNKDMGTGLGLSISYRIIQDHNGEITVNSEVGKWTKMKIKLPIEVKK